jgi:hypothetical protein
MDAQPSYLGNETTASGDEARRRDAGIVPLKTALGMLEVHLMDHAVSHTNGNKSQAARLLDMAWSTFQRRYGFFQGRHKALQRRGAFPLIASFVRTYLAAASGMPVHAFNLDLAAHALGLNTAEKAALRPLLEL